MGKVVEKKKKKGRPSLLDLQKRSLKQQLQEQKQQQKPDDSPHPPNHLHPRIPNSNPNNKPSPINAAPIRRSTRRNPNPNADDSQEADEDDEAGEGDDEELPGSSRKEKRLKFVLKLPSQRNSSSLNSGSHASDSNAEEETATANHSNKRKINVVDSGSAHERAEQGEKPVSCTKPTTNQQGTQLESEQSTPLPDKKLLLFILDRLQKKDTYRVFSEPVDPKELPDYHDIIEHPMDFGTVRHKLSDGAYANLEQFESDIFLICSNAMQYNPPDTIYFRQARSIQELAKKNFENLRQDSDCSETEPKIVRRGRPPTKNLKRPLGRPPLERVGSDFTSGAIPATGGESSLRSHYDLRKGPADLSERLLHGSRRGEVFSTSLSEQKSERNEEMTGFVLRGHMKLGKKQFILDENRRNTYNQTHPSVGQEPSVLSMFDDEDKQLMAVGLLTEFGYARSLARFSATLGPLAWEIASKKIKRSLPSGLQFGPGWVGENEAATRSMPPPSPPSTSKSKGTESSEKTEECDLLETPVPSVLQTLDGSQCNGLVPATIAPSITADRPSRHGTESEDALSGLNPSVFNSMDSSVGSIRSQMHPNPVIRPEMNGFNCTYWFDSPTQRGKLVREMHPTGLNRQASRVADVIPSTDSEFLHPVTSNGLSLQSSENSGVKISDMLPQLGSEALAAKKAAQYPQSPWPGSLQTKTEKVPPDLNVMFQSQHGSPSTSRVDSAHPDLALQL